MREKQAVDWLILILDKAIANDVVWKMAELALVRDHLKDITDGTWIDTDEVVTDRPPAH